MTSTVEYGQEMEPVAEAPTGGKFTVRLANFTGPFDLLLQLIGKHKLDVTEVALHQVTDEFIAYIRAMGDGWDLDEASEFLIIAATLLDLKAARLLPAAQVEDEEDLALLEARDLLFARLLQYKAFKEAAAHIAAMETAGARRYPRAVALEPRYADALPDLVLGIGPERLLRLAIKAMTPKPVPVVSIAHVHDVRVSVREHAALLRDRLRIARTATFRVLCADCQSTLEVVARFLALLELYREGLVGFAQVQALGELTVRWTGGDDAGGDLDIDEYAGSPAPAPSDATGPGASPSEAASPEAPEAAVPDADAGPSDVTLPEPGPSGADDALAGAEAAASGAVAGVSGADVAAAGAEVAASGVEAGASGAGVAVAGAEVAASGVEAGASGAGVAAAGAEGAEAGASGAGVAVAGAEGAEAGASGADVAAAGAEGAAPGADAGPRGADVAAAGAGDDVKEPQ